MDPRRRSGRLVAALLAGALLIAVGAALAVAGRAPGGATEAPPRPAGSVAGASTPATTAAATVPTPTSPAGPAGTATAAPAPIGDSSAPASSPSATAPAAGSPQLAREIVVYFQRRPQSEQDFALVFPVTRRANGPGVAREALGALIAGPTPEEAAAGYYSELRAMLVGRSTCGDPPVTVRIEAGLATVQLCQEVRSAGVGQDARARSGLEATLRQFPTVQRVRLLTRDGHCLFDLSGQDRCLRDT